LILHTLRGKIIAFSTLILLVLISATFFSNHTTSQLTGSVEDLFRNNLVMEDLESTLNRTQNSLTEYIRTKSSDSLRFYIKDSTRLEDDNEIGLLQKTIRGLIHHYLLQTEVSVKAKRGRDVAGYTRAYDQAQQDHGSIRRLLTEIQKIYLSLSLKIFSRYHSLIPMVTTTNIILLLSAFLTGFLILVLYSYKITDPLNQLAQAARAMARGDYETRQDILSSSDEVRTTTEAFWTMQDSIRKAFNDQSQRIALEKKLLGEEMKSLQMSHQLKEAELLALQTQINPHFLYNTLSAGFQLAMTENADHTADFLENLGAFIRYVLTNPSRLVPIQEEVECIQRFFKLMELRFGDRYVFALDVDPGVLDCRVPALILQPLVENSISHGLQDRETGGVVQVTVLHQKDGVCLCVQDNGIGMSREQRDNLLGELESPGLPESSIGLRNVIRRIKLATEGAGRVSLESPETGGFEIRVFIPFGAHNS